MIIILLHQEWCDNETSEFVVSKKQCVHEMHFVFWGLLPVLRNTSSPVKLPIGRIEQDSLVHILCRFPLLFHVRYSPCGSRGFCDVRQSSLSVRSFARPCGAHSHNNAHRGYILSLLGSQRASCGFTRLRSFQSHVAY